MYPQRFIIPNYMTYPMRSPGLFSRIFGGIKGFNWQGLLTNANKTLNVVNQTIPLVRQAGPMFNNMKSMLRLAKAFGNETTNKINNNNNNVSSKEKQQKEENIFITESSKESPNFFV